MIYLLTALALVILWRLNRAIKNQKKIMTGQEHITKAIADLQTTVDDAISHLNAPPANDAALETAATAIDSQVTRLKAALAPTTT